MIEMEKSFAATETPKRRSIVLLIQVRAKAT